MNLCRKIDNYITQFALLALCWTMEALKIPDSVPLYSEEQVAVSLENLVYSYNSQGKRSNLLFPSSFDLRISLRDEPLDLHLERSEHISTNIPTYVERDGVIVQEQSTPHENCAFYQDKKNVASVHLECSFIADGTCQFKTFGSFVYKEEHFILEELNTETDDVIKLKHRIVVPKTPVLIDKDFVRISGNQNFGNASRQARKRRATGTYIVELLIITDYSVFKFWYDQSTGLTNQEKRTEAIDAIRRYYAFLINGMNVRYSGLPGYTIQINFAGIYITESSTDALYIESLKSSESVDVNRTLSNFNLWILNNKNQLPAHDHAMLFTKYDVILNSNRGATGLAYLNAICTDRSQSVVEDSFNFLSQTIAAHELGHSLGAVHDGDENSCQRDAKHIMSTVVSATQGVYSYNPWVFSSCSKTEMSNLIDTLSNNCMLTQTSTEDPNVINQYLDPMIGQTYGADKQCELSIGAGSKACRNLYQGDYSSTCTGLLCLDVNSLVQTCALILPGDGTPCGNKKWCQSGRCVSSNEAPVVSNTCVFGDTPGVYTNGQTCQEILASTPWKCYDSTFRRDCCQTCERILNITNPGCPYGDRADCSAVTRGDICYDTNNARSCCHTCVQYETNIQDCQYGDKVVNCVRQSCTRYSALDFSRCCETCHNIPSGQTTTVASGVTGTGLTTTQGTSQSLPTWVIPTAAGGGGLLVVIIIIIGCYCACRNTGGDEDAYAKSGYRDNFSNLQQPYVQRSVPNQQRYKEPGYSSLGNPHARAPSHVYNGQAQIRQQQRPGNIIDRGASVRSNVSGENVYTEIDESRAYQQLQGQGRGYQGPTYTNKAYSHPRY